MAKYPNLWSRNGRYYLRMRVPKDLVKTLGKEHITYSLKTSDYRIAVSLHRTEQAKVEARFTALRHGREQDARVGGWAETGVDARYGAGFPTSMLAEDIAKIRYPGLDLSPLYLDSAR